MRNMTLAGPRVSAFRTFGEALLADGVNAICHGNTEGVQPNDKAILAHVQLFLVFWGRFYEDHPDAMDFGRQLCNDLVTGPYFNGLAQYGIGRGGVIGTGRTLIPDAPKTLNEDQARDRVDELFASSPGFTRPAIDDTSSL